MSGRFKLHGIFAVAGAALMVAAFALTLPAPVQAQAEAQVQAEDFPKSVQLIVGSSPGGGFDQYGRVTGRHLERVLPGKPTVVVQNMPGAGGIKSVSWLATAAPRDGSAIATMPAGAIFAPIQGVESAKYDPTTFNYLATLDSLKNMLIVWNTTPYKTADDAFTHEIIIGNTGGSSAIIPAMINRLIGTKFRVIAGYPGTNEIALAMERGEVEGAFNFEWESLTARPDWLPDGIIRVLMQVTFKGVKDDRLKGVPTLEKFVKSDEARDILEILLAKQEVGRGYMAPAGVPKDIVATWRKSFDTLVQDKDYLAQAEKMGLSINPLTGAETEAYVKRIYSVPQATVDKMLAEIELAKQGIQKIKKAK